MTTEHQDRLARLRARLTQAELDGLVVSTPSNIFYLSGFRGSSGALLVTQEHATLFSDFRYRLQAAEQAPDCQFEEVESASGALARVGERANARGLRRLGYENRNLTCEGRDLLSEGASGVELAPASPVEELRAVKSAEEVEQMRAAAGLADQALEKMASMLQPGRKEQEIALEGEIVMRRAGAEGPPFNLIVASGPRGALPHAETTDRELQSGDLVVVDIGARLRGYCSDMTRTFAVRTASALAQEIYALVYGAQRAAAAATKEGAICGEIDAVARDLIAAANYGEAFGHGLGHGVGIDVHEAPRLGKGEETALVAGNVVTVEPGIYLSEMGGVRLEDMVLVTLEGVQTLTGSPMAKELPVV